MSRRAQAHVARVLTVLAGLTILLVIGQMTVDVIFARHASLADAQAVEQLTKSLKRDASGADELHARYERMTGDEIERDRSQQLSAQALLAVVVVFIISAKRLVALRAPDSPAAPKYVQLRMAFPGTPYAPEATGPSAAAARRISVDVDLTPVDAMIARVGREPDKCVPILHAIQAEYRYLPEPVLRRVSKQTEITPAQLAGVASFYTQFRQTPMGECLIRVCHGTACHVAGAPRITDELRRRLDIGPHEDTDASGRFTIEKVACLGCCTLAPVAQRDEVTFGHLGPDTAIDLLTSEPESADAAVLSRHAEANADDIAIHVGMGSCCVANGSAQVESALRLAMARQGVRPSVKHVGCVGMCHQTPLVEVCRNGETSAHYARVQPAHAELIVREHVRPRPLSRRIRHSVNRALDDVTRGARSRLRRDHAITRRDPAVCAFLGPQLHIATEHYGRLSPTDLDEYLRHDGFKALRRCVSELSPSAVIDQVRASGLRGRGGAGFPTAEKWVRVHDAPGETKYIICNGDEGDPGAFMDRMLMESYPYRIIEGVAIAAHAVGATEAFFYIRNEYPLAVERMEEALQRCAERGIVGNGTTGSLRLHVRQGGGAFVCGEETALIASLQGERGMPVLRPPYPAERGLWDRPTLVNNVETYAVLPWIFRHGAAAFAALGTQKSTGTKVFALAGKVARGGLIEVPMGITIRRIVEDIGGGVKDGRRFKAVQVGGPSGGCLPAELADTPVDFEALHRAGAIMGSGGLVVLDDSDCMVDMARYFLTFTQEQSCGKCTPCRVGTRRMLEILERLCEGRAQKDDLDTLKDLARAVEQGSLCGLGMTAPNPVLTTLRYFREEYEAHLAGRCPAGRCKALIEYSVTDDCTGCTLCAQHCPVGAIALRPYERHEIDAEKCTRCDLCRVKCPENAVSVA